MKKKTIIIAIIYMTTLLAGCGNGKIDQILSHVDMLMNNHADSALQMLDSLNAEKSHWTKSQRMRYDLLYLKAENKAFVPLSSDSIAKDLVSYYDIWGNANERMMAHYLLGCVYRDKGDSPRAIESYLDAINQADTTDSHCDYLTLSRVYSQMSGVYYQQLLLEKSIKASNNASRYFLLINDTLSSIRLLDYAAGSYILQNKDECAEDILNKIRRLCLQSQNIQEALNSSTKLIYIYVKHNRLTEAKILIDEYDANSVNFDSNHELSGTKRIYYYYKGQYYEGAGNLDSAEHYYRKVYYPQMPFTAQNSMYKGLCSVYTKRHQADSIAKYALLYGEANDSSIAIKDQELTTQMAATYNYGLYQKETIDSNTKTHRAQITLIVVLIISAIIGILTYLKWASNKKKHEELKEEYVNAKYKYNKNIQTLQLLERAHKGVICSIQEELNTANKDNQAIQSELANIKIINAQFEEEKEKLLKDNEDLKKIITELQGHKVIQEHIENYQRFKITDIVEQIINIVSHPKPRKLNEKEWNQLFSAVSRFYPSLIYDLNHKIKATQREIRTSILTCMGFRESDICNLLDISSQQLTNTKISINKKMFNDKVARSLYKNLAEHYGIYAL